MRDVICVLTAREGCNNKMRIEMAWMIMIVRSWTGKSKVRMKKIKSRRGLDGQAKSQYDDLLLLADRRPELRSFVQARHATKYEAKIDRSLGYLRCKM